MDVASSPLVPPTPSRRCVPSVGRPWRPGAWRAATLSADRATIRCRHCPLLQVPTRAGVDILHVSLADGRIRDFERPVAVAGPAASVVPFRRRKVADMAVSRTVCDLSVVLVAGPRAGILTRGEARVMSLMSRDDLCCFGGGDARSGAWMKGRTDAGPGRPSGRTGKGPPRICAAIVLRFRSRFPRRPLPPVRASAFRRRR